MILLSKVLRILETNQIVWFEQALTIKFDYCAAEDVAAFIPVLFPDGRGYLFGYDQLHHSGFGLEMFPAQGVIGKRIKKILSKVFQNKILIRVLPRVYLHRENNVFSKVIRDVLSHDNSILSISLGTPGPQRKPVLQIADLDREIRAYIKIGWDQITRDMVSNEKKVLQVFGTFPLKYTRLPDVQFFQDSGAGFNVLVSSPLKLTFTPNFSDKHSNCLIEIAEIDMALQQFIASGFWITVQKRWKKLFQKIPNEHVELISQVIITLNSELCNIAFPFIWRLGDFSPWNLGLDRETGKLNVTDLESARPSWLPGWDLFHFFQISHFGLQVLRAEQRSFFSYFGALGIVGERIIVLLALAYTLDVWSAALQEWSQSADGWPKKVDKWFDHRASITQSMLLGLDK